METKWYVVKGYEKYEVSDGAIPVIRNRKTKRVLREIGKRKNVDLYDANGGHRHFYPLRVQFAAINNIRLQDITSDIIVTKDTKHLKIINRADQMKKIRVRPKYDKARQEELLRNTLQFIRAQLQYIQTGNCTNLLEILYGCANNAFSLLNRRIWGDRKIGVDVLENISTYVIRIIDGIKDGEVYLSHPTTVIYNEMQQYVRNRAKEALRAMDER